MTDRPILFSAPMIRALLSGQKTQTRRIFPNSSHLDNVLQMGGGAWQFTCKVYGSEKLPDPRPPRHQVGDRLWCREAWRAYHRYDAIAPRDLKPTSQVWFEADQVEPGEVIPVMRGRLRASMHMPRWASRLTLLVTEVRVQRLQDISEADAQAEGIEPYAGIDADCSGYLNYFNNSADGYWLPARESFRTLWDSINAKRAGGACAWAANPWVSATSFRVEKINIDQMPERIVHKHLNIRGSTDD